MTVRAMADVGVDPARLARLQLKVRGVWQQYPPLCDSSTILFLHLPSPRLFALVVSESFRRQWSE